MQTPVTGGAAITPRKMEDSKNTERPSQPSEVTHFFPQLSLHRGLSLFLIRCFRLYLQASRQMTFTRHSAADVYVNLFLFSWVQSSIDQRRVVEN